MPRGDGTGPAGVGPMTGRAAGYCAGYPVPGFMNGAGGFGYGYGGWGRGRGGGRGRHHGYRATGLFGWQRAAMGLPAYGGVAPAPVAAGYAAPAMSREDQLEALKSQAEGLEEALSSVKQRMDQLSDESTS